MTWPDVKLALAALIVLIALWKRDAAIAAVGMALGAHARIDKIERRER